MCCRDIVLYPNGDLEGKGNSISLFLRLQESIAQQNRLLAKIVFRVKNQINGENVEDKCMFTYLELSVDSSNYLA